jgi:hypothetical protein
MSGDPMGLFWASAIANRKRLGPTASRTSRRIGMRVGADAADAEAALGDGDEVPQPATTAARMTLATSLPLVVTRWDIPRG